MSNVKPGDLAIITFGPNGYMEGAVVEVLRPAANPPLSAPYAHLSDAPRWFVTTGRPTVVNVGSGKRPSLEFAVPDPCLKPLRDPGPEAVDEMVQKLGSPNKQGEMA